MPSQVLLEQRLTPAQQFRKFWLHVVAHFSQAIQLGVTQQYLAATSTRWGVSDEAKIGTQLFRSQFYTLVQSRLLFMLKYISLDVKIP